MSGSGTKRNVEDVVLNIIKMKILKSKPVSHRTIPEKLEMNAFYYGINLGWIAGIFLALFIVGASGSINVCNPQKYQSRFNAGNTFIWSSLAAVVGLAGILPILIMTVSMDDPKQVNTGTQNAN